MLITDYQNQLKALLTQLPKPEKQEALRYLCRTDLYFLLVYGLNRKDAERQWIFDRCREVQANPNSHLDLWSREHYKSTIITFAKLIQDVLASHGEKPLPIWNGREVTAGIFSHTRPIAKGFLRQIKTEFEQNQTLKDLFPDVLWQNPHKESPKWSEDDGIVVKRKSNQKEATIEAWGVVDGQPTGKHFFILNYDDLVTKESVNSPDMIRKTTESLELSFNLGSDGGFKRFIGTRYHYNDSYKTVMERGTATPRIYPATLDGTAEGEPVLLSRESLDVKRRDMGPYTFACQMLQDPKADASQGFREEWLRYYERCSPVGMTIYILVDPASAKKVGSDYTCVWVIGLGADGNYYVLDFVRDRLRLTERAALVMRLHRNWKPKEVRYERYGMMADIEHIKSVQEDENYRFTITEVAGQTSKPDRIKRLLPLFEQEKIYLPQTLHYTNHEGRVIELVNTFVQEEYKAFPVGLHDDMLDALSRIVEPTLPLHWPSAQTVSLTNTVFGSEFA
jgi:predicted phage terminase large subunit-like protein